MHSRLLILATASLVGLSVAGCGQKPAPAESVTANPVSEQAQSMRVVTVARRDIAAQVEATGRLVVREEASVGAEIPGYPVSTVLADEGDWVKQGQPLARLDDTLLRAQIIQAEATLAQQKANIEFKRNQLKRSESLAEAGALSVEAIEGRRTETASAEAGVLAAEAMVNEMKTRQARLVLRAPVAGRVLQRSINPGMISGAAAGPYFRIARDGLIELDAEMPNADIAHIQEGAAARVQLPTGETLIGKVRYISPRVEAATGLGRARIALPFNDALRPGGFASALFEGNASGGATVPSSAIRYESGTTSLMVVGADNKVVQTPVKLGKRVGEFVEVVDGVPIGTRVLERGAAFTLDGDVIVPVEVTEGSETAAAPAPAATASQVANAPAAVTNDAKQPSQGR